MSPSEQVNPVRNIGFQQQKLQNNLTELLQKTVKDFSKWSTKKQMLAVGAAGAIFFTALTVLAVALPFAATGAVVGLALFLIVNAVSYAFKGLKYVAKGAVKGVVYLKNKVVDGFGSLKGGISAVGSTMKEGTSDTLKTVGRKLSGLGESMGDLDSIPYSTAHKDKGVTLLEEEKTKKFSSVREMFFEKIFQDKISNKSALVKKVFSKSGANVIEKIKKELQSYPEAYREWKKADPKKFKATLLCFAAGGGHIEVVKALLDAEGIDVRAANTDGLTPFHCAVKAGHIDTAELLLKNGADIDAKTNKDARTTLSLIIFLNDEKCNLLNDERCEEKVKFLLERGASVDEVDLFGRTPLHLAIEKGNLNVVKALLEEKGTNININARGKYGCTLLHHASLHSNKDIVELLLKKGADPNLRNDDKNVPLHYASNKGHIDVVEALLKKGAEVKAVGSLGWTSLHYASDKGHIEVVKALLKKGADVNAINYYRKSPLPCAAYGGYIEIVKALIDKGADVNAADKDGNTPLHTMPAF